MRQAESKLLALLLVTLLFACTAHNPGDWF